MKKQLTRSWSQRKRVTTPLVDPPKDALTQQQFKSDCDMNLIVARANKGIAPKWLNTAQPQYGDFSDTPQLAQAYEIIAAAEQAFSALPAMLRRELNNDPTQLNTLTPDQIARYGLGKPSQEPLPPAAGQAAPQEAQTPPAPQKGALKNQKAPVSPEPEQ